MRIICVEMRLSLLLYGHTHGYEIQPLTKKPMSNSNEIFAEDILQYWDMERYICEQPMM